MAGVIPVAVYKNEVRECSRRAPLFGKGWMPFPVIIGGGLVNSNPPTNSMIHQVVSPS